MLRVGLTGELGSGKSTVARLLAGDGAIILSSDEIGRALMQPGQAVYTAIVNRFGPSIVLSSGQLNRPALAKLAFDPNHPRVEELNALVHPAVLAEQEQTIARLPANAIVVIESALLFTTRHAGDQPWRKRFDRIVVVTAPDDLKVQRFIQRTGTTEQEARLRLEAQRIPTALLTGCLLIRNDGTEAQLASRTKDVFLALQSAAHHGA